MAIVLATTKEHVTVVNTVDPDVVAAPGKTGWVPLSDTVSVGPGATLVVIRALAGHEVLTCYGAGPERGDVSVAMITRATVSVEGKPVDEVQVRSWGVNTMNELRGLILDLSTLPMVARP